MIFRLSEQKAKKRRGKTGGVGVMTVMLPKLSTVSQEERKIEEAGGRGEVVHPAFRGINTGVTGSPYMARERMSSASDNSTGVGGDVGEQGGRRRAGGRRGHEAMRRQRSMSEARGRGAIQAGRHGDDGGGRGQGEVCSTRCHDRGLFAFSNRLFCLF